MSLRQNKKKQMSGPMLFIIKSSVFTLNDSHFQIIHMWQFILHIDQRNMLHRKKHRITINFATNQHLTTIHYNATTKHTKQTYTFEFRDRKENEIPTTTKNVKTTTINSKSKIECNIVLKHSIDVSA